jgi:N-acetylneuraminic acid mutarotase
MIVWGGGEPPDFFADGAAYNPESNEWTPLATSPLSPRLGHAATWSGERMLVWAGRNDSGLGDGAAYDPSSDEWSAIEQSPLSPRAFPVAVWAGNELIVWGGTADDGSLQYDGAVYQP